MDLVQGVLAGNRLALARTLSHVENGTAEGRAALDALFSHTGNAHLIGITGASGTGKSSLVNQLALYYRKPAMGTTGGVPGEGASVPSEEAGVLRERAGVEGERGGKSNDQVDNKTPEQAPRRVAIVAVDPTSPFTGGAILGDRIRMRDLAGDPGVFIRSMATRGSLGGTASATAAVVQVLDAAGFELILIETVGAGQSEVEIVRLAHTTVVVEAPGLGDDIQAIKAGILEIADVLVVNKADLPGVENTERALRGSLDLAHPSPRMPGKWTERSEPGEPARQSEASGRPLGAGERALRGSMDLVHPAPKWDAHHGQMKMIPEANQDSSSSEPIWVPPVLRTVATEGKGIPELAQAIAAHRLYLEKTGGWEQRERWRLQTELDMLLTASLVEGFRSTLPAGAYEQALGGVLERSISPFQAVEKLINHAGSKEAK